MTIAEKLTKIAQNEQLVYTAGQANGLTGFWEAFQSGGNRTNYDRGFAGWTADMTAFLKPKYDMHPTNAYMMFGANKAVGDLVTLFGNCGITLDFSNCTSLTYLLHGSSVTHIGVVNTCGASGLSSMLASANALVTVDKVILKADGSQTFDSSSFSATNLENIAFEGMIGNNVWFRSCSKLTVASLLSILTALTKDSAKASGKTVTLATAHKAKIEADAACTAQLNAAIAAGWTVTYV